MIRAAVVFNLLFKEPRRDNRGLPGAGRRCGEGGAQSGGEDEGRGAGVRGASVPHREASLPASESEVSRTGQEWASTLRALWPGQRGNRGAHASHDVRQA